jgi:hypothetical protein
VGNNPAAARSLPLFVLAVILSAAKDPSTADATHTAGTFQPVRQNLPKMLARPKSGRWLTTHQLIDLPINRLTKSILSSPLNTRKPRIAKKDAVI